MRRRLNDFFKNTVTLRRSHNNTLSLPYSKPLMGLLDVLVSSGYLVRYQFKTPGPVKVFLKKKNIMYIKLISKPTKKVFVSYLELLNFHHKTPYTTFVLHTVKGIMPQPQALKLKLGGYLLCTVSFIK
jgi:small subunit ribosomal protein S8